jgi:dipeptidyl aminopeptidase/acylaminoacyl peptidase
MNHPLKFCLTIVLTLCMTPWTFAQDGAAKRPITHEALWMMKRVGAPVVSPDGKWAVYSVNEPSYEKDRSVSDLWVVATDGLKPPRRITSTKAAEEDVAWSPDSANIAFATKREGDEVSQIYVLNLAEGGEARRLSNVSTGAASPKWRPDGKAILFESRVYPGALDDAANKKIAAEHKDRKYNVRTYEHFPVRYWNEWLDDRQPTLIVQGLDQEAGKDILSGTALAHQSGFSGTETDSSVTLAPIWSPDGREVLFIATTERWNAAFAQVGYHVYRMPADGAGEPSMVTPTAGDYEDTKFSADGKSLYYKFAPHDAEVYHLARLYRASWPAAADARLVAQDFDREVARYALTPDGRNAYLLVPEGGKENLYRVTTQGGRPALIVEPASGGYTALEIAQRSAKLMLIGSYGNSISPSEVVRIDPLARTHVNLTRVDVAAAAAIDWQLPQHFYFTSAKGRNIHNMLVLPPKFDASTPCWC